MNKQRAKLLVYGDLVRFRSNETHGVLTGKVVENRVRTIFGTPIVTVVAYIQNYRPYYGQVVGEPYYKAYDLKPNQILEVTGKV